MPRLQPFSTSLAALLVATLAVPGCGVRATRIDEPRGPDLRASDLPAEGPVEGRAAFGEPIRLPGQAVLLIPFAFERAEGFTDAFRSAPASLADSTRASWTPLGEEASATGWLRGVYWQNLVFVDPAAGAAPARALLDGRGVITRFAVLRDAGSGNLNDPVETLVFGVVTADTDGDGRLGNADGAAVWLSRADGRDARPVTPAGAGYRLEGVEPDARSGSAFLRLRGDEDGDGRITTLDPARTWVVDPSPEAAPGAVARPLIDPALVERMESLLR